MKAAVYYSSTDTRIEDRPAPEAGPGEAVVEVTMCGICGSDLMDWYSDAKAPTVLGHEIVGRIAELGEGAHRADGPLSVGDRVFVHHHAPCGMCDLCRRGFETLCSSFAAPAVEPGGFAERVRIPATAVRTELLPLPDSVSDEGAACIEPLACCVRGVRRAAIRPRTRVVVIGLGQMGQLYTRAARAEGAEVVAVDPVESRRQLAAKCGAEPADAIADEIRTVSDGRVPEVVVLCTGAEPALALAGELVGKGSTLQLFAPARPGVGLPVSVNDVFFGEITVQATYSAGPGDTREALALLESGAVDVGNVVTHHFPLDRAAEAMAAAKAQADGAVKVVLDVVP